LCKIQGGNVVADRNARSVTLQQQLMAHWKEKVKERPPSEREVWLKSQEAIIALGSRQCSILRKAIRRDWEKLSRVVPGEEWLEAWHARDNAMPTETPDRNRRYSVRMVLGSGHVRYSEEGIPSRRWTPPDVVEVEDFLDLMSNKRANFYTFPPSPSAVAIHRMCTYSKAAMRRLARDGRW
jgi:hypothetical protein